MQVKFYENIEDECLKYAVIVSSYRGKWVFCKHKERDTYEIPGGHREKGESVFRTAERELAEETDAVVFDLKPVCVYSVTGKNRVNESGEETYGMLYYAEIEKFGNQLHFEIENIELFEEVPSRWTYPQIQPLLLAEVQRRLEQGLL